MPCTDDGPGPDYSREWRECEKDLCRARWILLQLVNICKTKDISLPSSLTTHIEREKHNQLKHRREDRDSVLQNITGDIQRLDRDIENIKKLGGNPSRVILEKKSKLKEDTRLLKDLSDEELLEGSWGNPVTLVDKLIKGEKHATTR
jgi:hypothetical protein